VQLGQGVRVIIVSAPVLRKAFDFYRRFDSIKNNVEANFTEVNIKRALRQFVATLNNRTSGLQLYITKEHEAEGNRKEAFAVIVQAPEDKKVSSTNYLRSLGSVEFSKF